MYYLITNSTMWGAGGRSEHTEVEFISDDKLKLTNILKERFLKALDDPEVDMINQEYIDGYLDVDEISDELEIQYKGDGFDITADRYIIVSDRNAKYVKDNPYVCKYCGQTFGPYTDKEFDNYGEEELWGHIQLEHEKEFEKVEDLDTPIMIEECYEVKEEYI